MAEEAKKERHPPGAQVALIDDFFEQIFAGRKKWIDPEKTYCTYDRGSVIWKDCLC